MTINSIPSAGAGQAAAENFVFTVDVETKDNKLDGLKDRVTYNSCEGTLTVEHAKKGGGFEKPVTYDGKTEGKLTNGEPIRLFPNVKPDIDGNRHVDQGILNTSQPAAYITSHGSTYNLGSRSDELAQYSGPMTNAQAKAEATMNFVAKHHGQYIDRFPEGYSNTVDFNDDGVSDDFYLVHKSGNTTDFFIGIFPTETN